MTGAAIVYFFLQSGAMNGALFPQFGEVGFDQVSFPKDAAAPVVPIRLFFSKSFARAARGLVLHCRFLRAPCAEHP